MRRLGVSESDIERLVRNADEHDIDPDGRPRYIGRQAKQRWRVVLAADDPELVITVHEKRQL